VGYPRIEPARVRVGARVRRKSGPATRSVGPLLAKRPKQEGAFNAQAFLDSAKGNCRDNAVVEFFFSSLKKERIKKQIYKNRELAIAEVADYINTFYNRTRRHSHLGGLSPEQFEAAHKPRRQSLH
jgi:hypothetical protein